jgi:hypothetical protein
VIYFEAVTFCVGKAVVLCRQSDTSCTVCHALTVHARASMETFKLQHSYKACSKPAPALLSATHVSGTTTASQQTTLPVNNSPSLNLLPQQSLHNDPITGQACTRECLPTGSKLWQQCNRQHQRLTDRHLHKRADDDHANQQSPKQKPSCPTSNTRAAAATAGHWTPNALKPSSIATHTSS